MKYVLSMFSFPVPKAPAIRDCSHQSQGFYSIPPIFCFEFLFSLIIKKIIERTKLLFPVPSVNDNNDVVSLVSIAILFLVITLLTNAKPVACKKASKNKFVLSSASDLQTSNTTFSVGATR